MPDFVKKFIDWLVALFAPKPGEATPTLPPATPSVPPIKPPEPSTPTVRDLKIGDTGEDVIDVQKRLKELGYNVEVDGEYGSQTKAAVGAFQRDNGIGQTFVVGPQTRAALFSAKTKPIGRFPNPSIMRDAADIAFVEAKKNLSWTGMDCEAEKYLGPLRKALGAPSGRYSWCASFVSWCVRRAGGEIPDVIDGNLTIAYVPAWETWAKKNGFWYSSRDKNFNPVKGDIAIYDWEGDSLADHIGIVHSYAPGSVTVYACEGNTSSQSNSNGNQTAYRARDWSSIRGFVRFPA
jgi:hypothetical protein